MHFSGTDSLIKKRNFYTQNNNFSIVWNGYMDSMTGSYNFGVTGSGGQINFLFKSGLIYDNNNYLIHSYQPFVDFSFEIDFSSGNYNVVKDGVPLIYGINKPTGIFDYFYISRSDSGINTFFDLSINGDSTPNYAISNNGFLFTTGRGIVTGYFYNFGSFPINIFSSDALPQQPIGFVPLTGIINNSGLFLFTGDFTNFNFANPTITNFHTNFNEVFTTFSIIDATRLSQFVFLQEGLAFNFDNTGTITQIVPYECFSGNVPVNFPANLYFSLVTISGTGAFSKSDFNTGAKFITTGYGNFLQSGLLTGNYSVQTGSNGLTGVFFVFGTGFAWATGNATGTFSGFGTGIATGIGYTGRAVGAFTGSATGQIYNGSGTLLYNGIGIGRGLNGLSLDYTGYINATGYINIHNLQYQDYFYINNPFNPLIKGVQFFNETGLVRYLSGNNNIYKVNGYYDTGTTNIYLQATVSGSAGNRIQITSGKCDQGSLIFSPFLTGGVNVGNTGISVVPISNYTGNISTTITGSGDYIGLISGFSTGLFVYTKTFTGSWDLFTGINQDSLVSLKRNGNFDDNTISGSGLFAPNSSMTIRVNHVIDSANEQTAKLIISGQNVLDPYIINLTN